MRGLKKKINGLKHFYFRHGPYKYLTISLWCYYLITSTILMYSIGIDFYKLFVLGKEVSFFYLLWFFFFLWLWEFSIRLYPVVWDSPKYRLTIKLILTGLTFVAHLASISMYGRFNRLINELSANFTLSDLFIFLNNTLILIILGIIFLALLKLKRNGLAAGLWGFVGFYHLSKLVPEKTGGAISNMKILLTMMGSMNFFILLGGSLVIMVGIIYMFLLKE